MEPARDGNRLWSMRLIRNPHRADGWLSAIARTGMVLAALAAVSSAAMAQEVDGVPVPAPRPEQAAPGTDGEAAKEAAPLDADDAGDIEPKDAVAPEPRPEKPDDKQNDVPEGDAPETNTTPADKDVVAPEPRPDRPADGAKPAGKEDQPSGTPKPTDAPDEDQKQSAMPPPRPAKMPSEELACRARLTELGVTFEELPQLADPAGCSVPWPISVSSLSKSVTLEPAAQLNCATALAAAQFAKDTMAFKAKAILGTELVAIRQASAYVCRPRNGTTKLSEHAFGNALDIGSFVLADEREIVVGSATSTDGAAFMLAVRKAACGPFKTVLGPGADADHANHFHFDLAKRRSGSTFCQ